MKEVDSGSELAGDKCHRSRLGLATCLGLLLVRANVSDSIGACEREGRRYNDFTNEDYTQIIQYHLHLPTCTSYYKRDSATRGIVVQSRLLSHHEQPKHKLGRPLSLADHQMVFNEPVAEKDSLPTGGASHCLMKRKMFMSPVGI